MGFLILQYVEDLGEVKRLTRKDKNSSIVGVYVYPSEDGKTCSGTCKGSGWSRHMKRGYVVHECGLRHPAWRTRLTGALFDYLGRNLVPKHPWFKNPPTW